ncbi:MAG: hypothetical protein EBV19_03590, partial [Flavobacteriia bacterium]|nr:hypothetical protein [Flavobacteriia bacterium]
GSYGKTLFQKATTLLWHILKVFKIFYKFPHLGLGYNYLSHTNKYFPLKGRWIVRLSFFHLTAKKKGAY